MKSLVVALLLLSSVSAMAAATLTCELKAGRRTDAITFNISPTSTDGDSSGGLVVGENDFSFGVDMEFEAGTYYAHVIFYENANVQDQVGETVCEFKLRSGTNVVCTEPIEYDGKKVAQFTCRSKL